MNNETLAPVYLDNKPVSLQDAKPKVSAILSAGGKPDATDVKWLTSQSDTQGKTLRFEEVVDRTSEPSKAIYLTSKARGASTAAPTAAASTFGSGSRPKPAQRESREVSGEASKNVADDATDDQAGDAEAGDDEDNLDASDDERKLTDE